MNNPNRLSPIADSDFPWGVFTERERMVDIVWHESRGRKRIFERYVLPNGVHYAFILDPKNGQQIFDSDGFDATQTHVDLGNGHILKLVIAWKGKGFWQKEKNTCTSFVEKKTTIHSEHGPVDHELSYDVDPIRHTLRVGYFHKTPREYTKIVLQPRIETDWGNGHTVFVSNRFQAQFKQNGLLEQVWVRGARRVLRTGVLSSGVTFDISEDPKELYLSGDELYDARIHQLIETIFGISYGDSLILDVDASVNRLISNIDGSHHKKPRLILAFRNALPASYSTENHPLIA